MTLWRARMAGASADALWTFTRSIHFDVRLAADDIAGSRAHVAGLADAGLLTSSEAGVLVAALNQVEEELKAGTFHFLPTDEDIHTAVERRVTELSGDVGPKLHTGRSRNDQVATDLRLYAKRALAEVTSAVLALQQVLYERAKAALAEEVYLPGYTHLQRAQPVLLAHHLLAHGWALARDVDRLLDCRQRLDVSPLGAGALAGTSLPLDPDATAERLGFDARFENSLDAVSDRDFVAEALFGLALLAVHLSRIGEEVVLWASAEFGFLRLDDAWATGSSMLPQKKNPDVAELARAKAGRLIGNLTGLLATLKGLPLAYNRDLQEDKEPLFDSVDQVLTGLAALTGLLATAAFDADRMAAAADAADAAAVDLVEYLVSGGMPFRVAYMQVAAMVRDAAQRHVPLA
ncbi:MAG: argininosuccinate lyase, partial [Acidimicrobiales bacterium]